MIMHPINHSALGLTQHCRVVTLDAPRYRAGKDPSAAGLP